MGNRVSRALEREKCVDFRMAPQGRLQARQLLDRPASNSGSPEFDNFEPGRFYARVIVPRPHRPGGVQRACSCSPLRGSGALKKHLAILVCGASPAPRAASVPPTRRSYLPARLRYAKRRRALAANTPAARMAFLRRVGCARATPPGQYRRAGLRNPRHGAARSSHDAPVATRTLGEER